MTPTDKPLDQIDPIEAIAKLFDDLASAADSLPFPMVARSHRDSAAFIRKHGPIALRTAPSEVVPEVVDMVLHCPVCHVQHIDEAVGEWDGKAWENPPHRSHLCRGCGHIWRPADIATNGVAAVKTRGKADSTLRASASPSVGGASRKEGSQFSEAEHERYAIVDDRSPTVYSRWNGTTGRWETPTVRTPAPERTEPVEGVSTVDEIADDIDAQYERAASLPCTCNIDENACRHCSSWERARKSSRALIATLQPARIERDAVDEDALILKMMSELHANVPEADRPQSMSDLSDDQSKRARNAIHAILTLLGATGEADRG